MQHYCLFSFTRGEDVCITVQPVTATATSASYKAPENATKTNARSLSVWHRPISAMVRHTLHLCW